MQQVEHRVIAFPAFIAGRGVDIHAAGHAQRFRFVQIHVDGAVRRRLGIVERRLGGGDFDYARRGADTGLEVGIIRVGDAYAVYRKHVAVDLRLERCGGYAPHSFVVFFHGLLRSSGYGVEAECYFARFGRREAEGDGAIRMHFGGDDGRGLRRPLGYRE